MSTTEWQVWITWSDGGKGGRQTFATDCFTEEEGQRIAADWREGRRSLGPSTRVHRVRLVSRDVTSWTTVAEQ